MSHNIFITSDTHFGHNKPFIYESRGFKNIYEHDKQIIQNWNSIIKPEDEIFHLGDVMLGDNDYGLSCLKQLKGNIHIIRGNHCTQTRVELYKNCYNVVEVCEGKYLNYKNYHFYLSHFPCLCSNYDDGKGLQQRTISLCGHSHLKARFADMDKGVIYHTELDAHCCYPILLDDIIEDLKNFFGNPRIN